MDEAEWLARRFEGQRARLRAVAFRMLGSASEAEDAVQESWLRLSRTDTTDVENLSAWLTTVVARVSLDMLRSRTSRREDPLDPATTPDNPLPHGPGDHPVDPEEEALLVDSVGIALLVVLQTLEPAERLAFVLHDMFAVPFDQIGEIVGRSPAAARQLASRARRRVQGASRTPEPDVFAQREIVGAFLAAARDGDFDGLLTVLDPDVVVRADDTTVTSGAQPEVRGALAAAAHFRGRARGARLALLDGTVGAAWLVGGSVKVAFDFTITDSRIVEIFLRSDPGYLRDLDVSLLE